MPRRIERLREASANELQAQQKELSEQVFRLRFQLSMGQADGLKKLRSLRKERARMLTVQRERELGKAVTAPAAPAKAAKATTAAKKTVAKKAPAKRAAKKAAVKKPAEAKAKKS